MLRVGARVWYVIKGALMVLRFEGGVDQSIDTDLSGRCPAACFAGAAAAHSSE
jgi:hypothetical protein